MQIHELNERKVRQQNRTKAGIASQLIKKAQKDAQTNLAQQAQQLAPATKPTQSSTKVVSGGPTPDEQAKLDARIAAQAAATAPVQQPVATQPVQQPVQQPVAKQQAATPPAQQKPLTKWGAIKNAFVDSTRGKWDPAYAYGDPGRPTTSQAQKPASDLSAELSKLGVTDRQVAGIGKILQQTNNYNTRLTKTGDPAVDKFLQAMGYTVK